MEAKHKQSFNFQKMKINKLFSLEKKIVIITGATGLMGKQHAHAIAAYGGIPILIDINKKALKDFSKVINEMYNINTTGYVVNITNEESVKKNCKIIIKKYKKIDALINNAANNPKVENTDDINFSRLENFPLDIWQKDLDVTLKGTFLCIKYYGFLISKNQNGGSIVNISSDLGLIAPDQRLYKKNLISSINQPVKPITYSVIKTGLIGLTRYLATYWADQGVRCNALSPGGIYTNQSEEFVKRLSLEAWHLERSVSAIRAVVSQIKIKRVLLGGSSISFRSLFVAVRLSFSAIQTIATFHPPS